MLPPRVVEAFESLRKGGAFPHAWLATLDKANLPRVRTVKICGFNLNMRTFYIGTHARHDKVVQLQANPRAELCLVDLVAANQLRFACEVTIQSGSSCAPNRAAEAEGEDRGHMALRERFWLKLSSRSKIEIYQAHPQQPRPPASFVLLHLRVVSMELEQLLSEPPRRYRYRLLGDGSDAFEEQLLELP